MFTQVITVENYGVKVLNAERVFTTYENEMLCKYDRTEEGLTEMITDLVEFAIEDKIIKRKAEKAFRDEITPTIMAFVIA